MGATTGYIRFPTIHADTIVFVAEDALFTVAATGGVARRLTTAPGAASFPFLSPDGRQVAYAARDEGPQEVYVMPAVGGTSTRVTHLGVLATQPVAWSADGKRIVVRSSAARPFLAHMALYEVAPGGHPVELAVGPARAIARQPRGKGVVLGINTGDPARWKRYRGGTAGRLWIDAQGTGAFKSLIDLPGNLGAPMWIAGRIYFISDHEGHGNLYSCTPTGRGLRRHTDHDSHYARYASSDGRRIVYHAGADLYLYDPQTDEARLVPVTLQSDRRGRARRFSSAARHLEDADLHPQAHSLALNVRGGAYTLALWEGAVARHGTMSSERRRLTRWLPDGKRLVTLSDARGEEELLLWKADGTGRAKRIRVDIGRALDVLVAPKGADRLAVANHRQEVHLVDLKTGKSALVDRSPHHRIQGLSWSPDGRWLAYAKYVTSQAASIHLYDTRLRKVHEITTPDFIDLSPSFDPEGKYLYFLSHRVFDPVYDTQQFNLGFPRGVLPCLIPLDRDTPSPFDDAARAPKPVGSAGDKGAGKKDAGKKGAKGGDETAVHLDGIRDRVVGFPVPEQRYVRVLAARGRVLLLSDPVRGFLTPDAGNAKSGTRRLQACILDTGKVETVSEGVSDVAVGPGGTAMVLQMGQRLRVVPSSTLAKDFSSRGEASRESGWIDLERLRVELDPGLEWGQMFDEAWRLQRDHFWVEDMTQVDWDDVHARYRPLVDRVATRGEFSDLMWEMQGELGTSHCYEMGGDYSPPPAWYQGVLGADIGWSARRKRWIVERVPQGDSWTESASSPLARPGLGIKVGDELVEVNGQALSAKVSPAMCLVNQARRAVQLTVRRGTRVRRLSVRTLATDQALRYRDWVEGNRERVHKATRGRVGYVHIPNMGPLGFSEFHRYFPREVNREGLIVDVRYNGGGHVSQLLLEKLRRKRIAYGSSRWMGVDSYPSDAPMGPLVCLTNEFAGSDGDIFSHGWKLYGLGPLIGKRTWGGVVGIWPRHALADGTVTTQPEFAHWFVDTGWGVENYGTDPDIEVDIAPQDWAAGRDPQLDRGLAEIEKIIRREKPKIPNMQPRPNLKAPRLPKRSR
ncbi:MAG: PDZ domain-containing protein [Planctomycetota bacterium]|nr:PDZ domain-containing protein [Planctomycetota bacterium]